MENTATKSEWLQSMSIVRLVDAETAAQLYDELHACNGSSDNVSCDALRSALHDKIKVRHPETAKVQYLETGNKLLDRFFRRPAELPTVQTAPASDELDLQAFVLQSAPASDKLKSQVHIPRLPLERFEKSSSDSSFSTRAVASLSPRVLRSLSPRFSSRMRLSVKVSANKSPRGGSQGSLLSSSPSNLAKSEALRMEEVERELEQWMQADSYTAQPPSSECRQPRAVRFCQEKDGEQAQHEARVHIRTGDTANAPSQVERVALEYVAIEDDTRLQLDEVSSGECNDSREGEGVEAGAITEAGAEVEAKAKMGELEGKKPLMEAAQCGIFSHAKSVCKDGIRVVNCTSSLTEETSRLSSGSPNTANKASIQLTPTIERRVEFGHNKKGKMISPRAWQFCEAREHSSPATETKREAMPIVSEEVANMIHLPVLNAATLLEHLRLRLERGYIYTWVGQICLALNPFSWEVSNHLYTDNQRKLFRGVNSHDQPPHVYAIAEKAFQALGLGAVAQDTIESGSQSILVSGESGAGKTETVKLMMHYLVSASGSGARAEVAPQLLASNPLLEAFGNAQTLRNHNSSRFGKLIELQFDAMSAFCGSRFETMLLERSRVVLPPPAERNYHIFYQMLCGLTDHQLNAFLLSRSAASYSILQNTSTIATRKSIVATSATVDDGSCFATTRAALCAVGLGGELEAAVWQVLSCVLLMGQIEFESLGEGSGPASASAVRLLAASLGMPAGAVGMLSDALCTRTFAISGSQSETCSVVLTVNQAREACEALAKVVYSRLFSWLISKCNERLVSSVPAAARIYVLDIFGFESFEKNSLEQLCINYANETLQQQFVRDTFKEQKDEYESEGLRCEYISYVDNQACLDLLANRNKCGIFQLLDEQTLLQTGTDEHFVIKVRQIDARSVLSAPSRQPGHFTIKHYAGDVTYDSAGFRAKNILTLRRDVPQLICENSSLDLLRELLDDSTALAETVRADAAERRRSHVELTAALLSPRHRVSNHDMKRTERTKEDQQIQGTRAKTERQQSAGALTTRPHAGSEEHKRSGRERAPEVRTGMKAAGVRSDQQTTCSLFLAQQAALLRTIQLTGVHYVRCIKPNPHCQPYALDSLSTSLQLSRSGVLDAIRVARLNYPTRMTHGSFLCRYAMMFAALPPAYVSARVACISALRQFGMNDDPQSGVCQVGATRVYLKAKAYAWLEAERKSTIQGCVLVLQSHVRGALARRSFRSRATKAEDDERLDREERTLITWVNSLGLSQRCCELASDCRSGLLLLHMVECVGGEAGSKMVDWRLVDKKPSIWSKVANCNYAMLLMRQKLKLPFPSISGQDIIDGNRKLILGIISQLMRYHINRNLSLVSGLKGISARVSEADVLKWANACVASTISENLFLPSTSTHSRVARNESGTLEDTIMPDDTHSVTSFKDPSLRTGRYLLRLISSIERSAVQWSAATRGVTYEERKANAKLVLSSARRAGCAPIMLWEDICEVNGKKLLPFFSMLMVCAQRSSLISQFRAQAPTA